MGRPHKPFPYWLRIGGGRHDARFRHLGLWFMVNVNRASAPLRGVASLRVGLRRMGHLFAVPFAELRSREKQFFPDLPDLDPPPYAPEITDEECEFFQKVVDQGEEKKRRVKRTGTLPWAIKRQHSRSRRTVQLFPGIAASRGPWPRDNAAFAIKQFLRGL